MSVSSEDVTMPSVWCTARRNEMKEKHTRIPSTPRTGEKMRPRSSTHTSLYRTHQQCATQHIPMYSETGFAVPNTFASVTSGQEKVDTASGPRNVRGTTPGNSK